MHPFRAIYDLGQLTHKFLTNQVREIGLTCVWQNVELDC